MKILNKNKTKKLKPKAKSYSSPQLLVLGQLSKSTKGDGGSTTDFGNPNGYLDPPQPGT